MTTASDRMAHTRLAIVEYVQRTHRGEPSGPATEAGHTDDEAPHGRWDGVKSALQDWWRNHPLHMGLEMAQPAVIAYARERPLRLLALSAAAGAALVLARPWRLISVTGLLMAAIRSPQLSSAVLSALRSGGPPAGKSP